MGKFLIPPDLSPGVYRAGIGFFIPGQEITLPDAASVEGEGVSLRYVPLDAEALALQEATRKVLLKRREDYIKAYEKAPGFVAPPEVMKLKKIGGDDAPAKPAASDKLTVKQAAEKDGKPDALTGRAADK